jgi:hypothetical protein
MSIAMPLRNPLVEPNRVEVASCALYFVTEFGRRAGLRHLLEDGLGTTKILFLHHNKKISHDFVVGRLRKQGDGLCEEFLGGVPRSDAAIRQK